MSVLLVLVDGPNDRVARRAAVLAAVPSLWAAGADHITLSLADELADVPGPNPFAPKRGPVGLVDVGLPAEVAADAVTALRAAGFGVHAYEVETTVPTTYGQSGHNLPDADLTAPRSPGVVAVSLLQKRADLDDDTFVARWHGVMSPVSAAIQPRTRYVRHRVLRPLTPEAPPWAAIVAEGWPSPRHVTNPFLFYGASTPWGLVANMLRIVRAVRSITPISTVRTFMASEWILVRPQQRP